METLLRCFPASNFPSPPCCCSSSPSRACAPFSINPDFPIPDTAGQFQRKEDRIAEPQVRVVNFVPICTPSSASVLTTSLLLSAVVAQKCPLEDGWNHDATQARSSPARIHFAELSRESCTSKSPHVFTRRTAPLCMDPDSCTLARGE